MDRRHIDWAIAARRAPPGRLAEATVLDHLREVLLGEGDGAQLPARAARALPGALAAVHRAGDGQGAWRTRPSTATCRCCRSTRWAATRAASASRWPPSTSPTATAQRHRPHCHAGHLHARQQARRGPARAHRRAVGAAGAVGRLRCCGCPAGRSCTSRARPRRTWPTQQRHLAAVPDPGGPVAGAAAGRRGARGPAPARAGLHAQGGARGQAATPAGSARTRLRGGAGSATSTACCAPASRAPSPTNCRSSRARIAPFGFRNSLAQLALKFTAPGVPDLYQGCEQWNFSLVDPGQPPAGGLRARWRATWRRLQALYRERLAAAQHWRALHATPPTAASSSWSPGGCCSCGASAARCSATAATCRWPRKARRRNTRWPLPASTSGEAVLVVAARLT